MKDPRGGVWRLVGTAPPGPITALAARDRFTFLAGSLAGASLSRDGGETWEWLSPGAVGPLVTAVAFTGSSASGLMVAGTGSLYLGDEAGGEWRALDLAALALAPLDADRLAVIDAEGGVIVLDGSNPGRITRIADLPGATAVAQDPAGSIWTVVDGRLRANDGVGTSIEADVPGLVADLVGRGGPLVALLEDGRVCFRNGPNWSTSDPGVDAALVDASDGASLVAALGERAVAWTRDGGATWRTQTVHGEPTAMAVAAAADAIIVGTADGLVSVLDPTPGSGPTTKGARRDVRGPIAGVVAEVAWDARTIAVACPGATWRTDAEAAADWTCWARARGSIDIAALTTDPAIGDLAVIDAAGVMGSGWTLDLPVGVTARAFALSTTQLGRQVVVTDGHRLWAAGAHADGWIGHAEPDDGQIVTVALGRPGDREPATVLVGTIAEGGVATVRALLDGRWVTLANGEAAAARVRIAVVDGPRGVYAAIGSVVFRPAMVGSALLAPEELSAAGETVLGLAAARGDGEDLVVALTARAIHVSKDGGLAWTEVPLPGGPPATALALRVRPLTEALVGRLGGEVLALAI